MNAILQLQNWTHLIHTWREDVVLPSIETKLFVFGQLYQWSQPHEEEKLFSYNECNFTFVKLSSFNTHMEKQCCLALHRHRITLLLVNCVDWANHMKPNLYTHEETTLSYPVWT